MILDTVLFALSAVGLLSAALAGCFVVAVALMGRHHVADVWVAPRSVRRPAMTASTGPSRIPR